MTLVDRVRNILLSPAAEWNVIEAENTAPADLVTSYLAPLAAASAVAGFIGSTLLAAMLPFGRGVVGTFVGGIVMAGVTFVMTIVGCFIIAFITNALAPTFGGRQDTNQALKMSVYSYTPTLIAGLAGILPLVGTLFAIVGWVYSLYLTYLGLPVMMKAPKDKAPAYTIVIVICSIIVGFLIAGVMAVVAGLGFLGSRVL